MLVFFINFTFRCFRCLCSFLQSSHFFLILSYHLRQLLVFSFQRFNILLRWLIEMRLQGLPYFCNLLFLLVRVIIFVNLDSQLLFGKRGSMVLLKVDALRKLLEWDWWSFLILAAWSGEGDRARVEFENIWVNRICGACEFLSVHLILT